MVTLQKKTPDHKAQKESHGKEDVSITEHTTLRLISQGQVKGPVRKQALIASQGIDNRSKEQFEGIDEQQVSTELGDCGQHLPHQVDEKRFEVAIDPVVYLGIRRISSYSYDKCRATINYPIPGVFT